MVFSTKKKNVIGRTSISVTLCVVMIAAACSVTMSNAKPATLTYEIQKPLCYTFSFLEPVVQEKIVLNHEYSTIHLDGCMGLGKEAGAPTLPVKFVQMLLPPMTTVNSIVATGTPVKVQLRGFDLVRKPVLPYQNEVPLNDPLPDTLVVDTNLYASSSPYPSMTINSYDIGYSHGYAILDFSLNPVQYLPQRGELYYYPKMTVTITLRSTGEVNQFFANNPDDERYVQSLVSNPEMAALYRGLPTCHYQGGLCNTNDRYDYVIITTTQNGLNRWNISGTLTYNWSSLIAAHTAEGLNSRVVTVQSINANPAYWNTTDPLFNDSQAHIRNFCRSAYMNWQTRYVLVAGDAPFIPARQLYYSYEGNVDSDIYWSNLDKTFNADHDALWGEEGDRGFDLYAELYIGRIICDTPQDVSNWLTKNFYYMNSMEHEYFNNAAFYGGDSGWNCQGDDFVDYGAVKTTSNYLGPNPGAHGAYPAWLGKQFGFETWNAVNQGNQYNLSVKWTAESPNPGWRGGSESVAIAGLRNAINSENATLISAFAHADLHMSCDVYDTEWDANYHNTKPFFITDMGCHCGDFDAGDGVLESMLFHSNTARAFACTYNTGYGWGSFDDTNSSSAIQMKSFWDYFFDIQNNSQTFSQWQFGKGQAWSKDTMAPTVNWTYSSAPGSYRGVIECCLFFGDPALLLKSPAPSDPPAKPSKPIGATLAIWHKNYTYTSSTNDPNGDQIYYLFDWGDGSNSGWLGPYNSGQSVTGTHAWNELGIYSVKVKARDIWSAGSVWSDPLNVTVTDNTPPNTPTIIGSTQGKPGLPYLFDLSTTDPQNQDVYYFIDWGDNTTTDWIGPYLSGVTVHVTHPYTTKGDYIVRAKAKDTFNAESNWTTFTFHCPAVLNPPQTFLAWLFEHFPHSFPILRHLLGYS